MKPRIRAYSKEYYDYVGVKGVFSIGGLVYVPKSEWDRVRGVNTNETTYKEAWPDAKSLN